MTYSEPTNYLEPFFKASYTMNFSIGYNYNYLVKLNCYQSKDKSLQFIKVFIDNELVTTSDFNLSFERLKSEVESYHFIKLTNKYIKEVKNA